MIRFVLCFCVAVALTAATSLFQDQSSNAWTPLNGSVTADDSVRHNNHPSLRAEASVGSPYASARSSAIHLTIGKTYKISGWVRTENLAVKDLERSPIASGAAVTMESMPFDYTRHRLAVRMIGPGCRSNSLQRDLKTTS